MSEPQTKPLVSLKAEEMEAVAIAQGIEVEGKTRQQLMKEIKTATSLNPQAIEIPEINQEDTVKQVATGGTGDFSGERLKVNFPRQDGISGTDNIVYILNGYRFEIMRDEDVEVPIELLDSMDTCVVTDYKHGENGKPVAFARKRFPYQMVR